MSETTRAGPEMQSAQGSLHLPAAQSPFLVPSLATICLTITADPSTTQGFIHHYVILQSALHSHGPHPGIHPTLDCVVLQYTLHCGGAGGNPQVSGPAQFKTHVVQGSTVLGELKESINES